MNCPASTRMLDAHPTMSCRWFSSMSRQNGCWRRMRSSDSMMTFGGKIPVIVLANRLHLFSDVDCDRTPANTAPTADAPAGAELVDPGAELVGKPLAVARSRARTD